MTVQICEHDVAQDECPYCRVKKTDPAGAVSDERLINLRKEYRHRAHSESRAENDHEAQALTDVADALGELLALRQQLAELQRERDEWRVEAEKTLDHLSRFLQNIGAPHAVEWRTWIDNAEQQIAEMRGALERAEQEIIADKGGRIWTCLQVIRAALSSTERKEAGTLSQRMAARGIKPRVKPRFNDDEPTPPAQTPQTQGKCETSIDRGYANALLQPCETCHNKRWIWPATETDQVPCPDCTARAPAQTQGKCDHCEGTRVNPLWSAGERFADKDCPRCTARAPAAELGAPLSDLVHRGPPPQTTFAAQPAAEREGVIEGLRKLQTWPGYLDADERKKLFDRAIELLGGNRE